MPIREAVGDDACSMGSLYRVDCWGGRAVNDDVDCDDLVRKSECWQIKEIIMFENRKRMIWNEKCKLLSGFTSIMISISKNNTWLHLA